MTSKQLGRTSLAAASSLIGGSLVAFLSSTTADKDANVKNKEDESEGRTASSASTGGPAGLYSSSSGSNSSRSLLLLPLPTSNWMENFQKSQFLPITNCEGADPSFPNLSRFGKHSFLKRHLTNDIYVQLKDKKTPNGVTLEDMIKSGVSLPWGARPVRGCGIYAGDAESYQTFAPLLVPILEDWHHFRITPRTKNKGRSRAGTGNALIRRQVTNLNPNYVLRQNLDPSGEYILQTRMRVARSIQGFAFSPCISRQKRRELEELFKSCAQDWSGDEQLQGTYTRVMDMSNEQHDDLIEKHILFHDPDEYSLSAGLGRDWPDARGVYMNDSESPEFMIWLNAEDHLRVISSSKGGDLYAVFKRLSKALTALETSLQSRGYGFCADSHLGFLNTSPENLGTALRASVFVKLVRLGQQPGFDDLLDRLRLESSTRFRGSNETGRYTGIFDIANSERLGQTEVQLINTMINGVGRLIALEKRLERGERINLDDIR